MFNTSRHLISAGMASLPKLYWNVLRCHFDVKCVNVILGHNIAEVEHCDSIVTASEVERLSWIKLTEIFLCPSP